MQERGSPSERAVAHSFNAMALQLQTQVQEQKERLQLQAQQLELAQLLIEVAPLPVTVRRSDGVCLDGREEWQRLFQSPLPTAAGDAQPAVPVLPHNQHQRHSGCRHKPCHRTAPMHPLSHPRPRCSEP